MEAIDASDFGDLQLSQQANLPNSYWSILPHYFKI